MNKTKGCLIANFATVRVSRQFRDFDDYTCCWLISSPHSSASRPCPWRLTEQLNEYLEERLQLLDQQLATVTRLAKDNELPDAILTESGLKSPRWMRRCRIGRRR